MCSSIISLPLSMNHSHAPSFLRIRMMQLRTVSSVENTVMVSWNVWVSSGCSCLRNDKEPPDKSLYSDRLQ